MTDQAWTPWKMTAIGLALVIVTALGTGLVVAYWTGREPERSKEAPAADSLRTPTPVAVMRPPQTTEPRVGTPRATLPQGAAPAAVPAVPPRMAIDACNQYAAAQAGQHDKTTEVVKDAAIGTLLGAAIGAAGGAIADGGKGAGKGAAIGGVVGAGGGTLYGLNESRQRDQRYRDAYAACMRSRGFSG